MLKNKKYNIPTVPLSQLFPSIVTMLALCLGITAVRYALDDKFDTAAILIIVASVMDGLDGRLARLLNTTTAFGAQLDSLADLVSFGVAPAIVTYLWSLYQIPYKGVGWAVILLFITCAAFRLARFNISRSDPKNFSIGVPMPAAACLCITPMILSFQILDLHENYWLIAIYMISVGILIASRVPTFVLKHMHIQRNKILPIMLMLTILIILLLIMPWIVFPILSAAYLISIPFSIISYKKIRVN
ncbi:MAG: CDP-diacylglycerol--serine O-phosphatidyltransferase [Candidatus Lariskella arthropodorum]